MAQGFLVSGPYGGGGAWGLQNEVKGQNELSTQDVGSSPASSVKPDVNHGHGMLGEVSLCDVAACGRMKGFHFGSSQRRLCNSFVGCTLELKLDFLRKPRTITNLHL